VVSLSHGAALLLGADEVLRAVVEMDHGSLILTSVEGGACLAVLANWDWDISQVAYEMTQAN